MNVERFYSAILRQEAAASVKLDGETWSLPRFMGGQEVWAAHRPAVVVDLLPGQDCGAHRGEYRYSIRFLGVDPDKASPWPYCESMLEPRD